MDSDDIITGCIRVGEEEWQISFGYSDAVWKNFSISEIGQRDDFRICSGTYEEVSSGSDVLNLTFGPSAGGLSESVKFNIYTYGERILSVTPEPWYKDRHIKVTGDGLLKALLKIERYNGTLSTFYSSLLLRGLEDESGIAPDDGLNRARLIMNEIARISDHLGVIGKLAEGASQNVAYHYLFLLREKLLRIISRRFGHRYFFGINGYGGLARNASFKGISSELREITDEFMNVWHGLEESRIFIDRIQGTASVKAPWLVGPAARAAGMETDTRIHDSRLPYRDLGFRPVVHESEDALSRVLVRKDEISVSCALIEEAERNLNPPVAIKKPFPERIDCTFTSRAETPGGDSLMRIEIENSKIHGIYVRPASLQNIAAFSEGMKRNLLTDFVFGYEGLGIHISELGGFV